jgi:hypothetical protein
MGQSPIVDFPDLLQILIILLSNFLQSDLERIRKIPLQHLQTMLIGHIHFLTFLVIFRPFGIPLAQNQSEPIVLSR